MVAQLPDVARQVLDRIASGEAKAYDVLFGGHRFKSFSDHPRIKIPLQPGLYSTAAGRYQMLASTWDAQKARLGLRDFSPENQDLAAWDLAQRTYLQKTGRDLAADAAKGAVDYSVLGNQWTSLKRTPPRGSAPENPGATSLAAPSPAGPQVPLALAPLPPDFATSPLALEHSLHPARSATPSNLLEPAGSGLSLYRDVQFSPVMGNPFAGSLPVEPVDHDPFAKEESPK